MNMETVSQRLDDLEYQIGKLEGRIDDLERASEEALGKCGITV